MFLYFFLIIQLFELHYMHTNFSVSNFIRMLHWKIKMSIFLSFWVLSLEKLEEDVKKTEIWIEKNYINFTTLIYGWYIQHTIHNIKHKNVVELTFQAIYIERNR